MRADQIIPAELELKIGNSKSHLADLTKKRDTLDELISSYGELLSAELGSENAMKSSLVDKDGFPLANVNHLSVTDARKQINTLQNDRKLLTTEIETKLFDHHALLKQRKALNNQETPQIVQSTPSTPRQSFLTVTDVTASSPAAEATLQRGDSIVKFGNIDSKNFIGMNQIAQLVQKSENQRLTVAFTRKDSDVIEFTSLVPKKWTGRGLLGCALNPS